MSISYPGVPTQSPPVDIADRRRFLYITVTLKKFIRGFMPPFHVATVSSRHHQMAQK